MNNVDISRYGKRIVQAIWDPEPKNDDTSPIWCLGRRYDSTSHTAPSTGADRLRQVDSPVQMTRPAAPSSLGSFYHLDGPEAEEAKEAPLAMAVKGAWPPDFLDDFEARIWLTYRSAFEPILKSDDPRAVASMSLSVRLKSQLNNQPGFTSDTGWGCMIRSGQSLLANALAIVRLGREWRRGQNPLQEKRVLALFSDDPRAPFSIHKFVEHGAIACGTYPGQWFGPSATAKCIEALSMASDAAGLRVYVTGDGPDVFEETLLRIARKGSPDFHPTLLLVGTRLGIDRITPVYCDALKNALCMPQSVGIAGGRPSSSHYFVGIQGSSFLYLDPHQPRPALPYHDDANDYTLEEVESCHTRRIRRIPLEEMDPSMLIGFLFQTEDDWRAWRKQVSETPGKAIFHVADAEPSPHGFSNERDSAVDEVETLDDDDDE